MKCQVFENPSPKKAYRVIEEGIRKRVLIVILACCSASYEGRARSRLEPGERLIVIKPDGTFMIHQDRKVDPVNWQPPRSRCRSYMKKGKLYLESIRRSPEERLEVEIHEAHLVSCYTARDRHELEVAGHERDMGDMIMAHPHLIEKGFRPVAREYSTDAGFIDILGKDENGSLVIIELKSRKAGVSAVKQLKRYLDEFRDDRRGVRGMLVAPSITHDAMEMLEDEGLEFRSLEPPRELRSARGVTLDNFS
ncbi:endonuclease NucS [Methanothermobacter wolfeii]|uniref:endonuclease NucS n=1 Tax=Methanothermobacter wolfeii TaxID=145261 RepID=UPI0024B39DFB|nr:endonuclease NucS [Methanothermobacter wolfeii]MDI6702706.1 endonuclease NucS [Methanothermobacter wolfeii]MDI6841567.1 endonuclease NucS [Methanothermobacter wolfeii]